MRRYACMVVWVAVMVIARDAGAATPSDVDFGNVDIGASAVRYMSVTAPGMGTNELDSASIFNDANHWFSFAGNGCDGAPTCVFAPLLLSNTAQVIPFRCTPPANATGVQVSQVIFSNSQVAPLLVCSASAGLLQVTPPQGVLNFGAIDLDRPIVTATTTIKIKNIGTATVTTAPGVLDGTDVARFTSSSLASTVLAPGDEFDIVVTYTPIAERTVNDPDTATITINLIGPSQTPIVLMMLRGHGVDRHATLIPPGMVPDTFLNPGGAAPEISVAVGNTGGAVLGLTNPTVTGTPVWSLANPEPADVPGFGTFTYNVRFYPSVPGPSPPGVFTVHTSDPDVPTLTFTLNGLGKQRQVMMGPATIDLGYVGIGTTAKVSALTIANLDGANPFQIRSLFAYGGDNAFDIPGARDANLEPGTTTTFDVTFTPTHAGAFDATAVLRLDADSAPAATIALHGEGVFVDVGGGGGCSSSGGNTGGGAVILIALLALRRRTRLARLAARIAIGIAGTAIAQADTRNLDLSVFDPAPSTTSSWFQLQAADVGHEGDWAASALVSYADEPLVLHAAPNDNVSIRDRTMFELGGAFAFGDRFEAGIRFPLYLQDGENLDSPTLFGEAAASGTAAGDLAVNAKARLWSRHGPSGDFVIGTALTLSLPTESSDQFAGSGKPQLEGLALGSFERDKLAFGAQLGGVIRANALFHDVDQGNGILWGLGASYRVAPELALQGELFGELVPSGLHDAPTGDAAMGSAHALDAIEALVGAHYQVERRFNVGVAIGRGVTSAPGTAAVRGTIALTFTPTAKRGIAARDRTQVDTDHDGIPDDVDKCPTQPEDKDGFQDEDGCPDPDNDRDGIPDTVDKCPNLPEDKDGFEDADGCPDVDNDHDGIPDRFDKCPNEPETINGIDDEDGCPDAGAGLVAIVKDRVTLGESIALTPGGKISPTSFNVLGQLGATLRAHTELIKIRVKGKHAQLVIDWLVQYGIAAMRLEAQPGDDLEITIVDRY